MGLVGACTQVGLLVSVGVSLLLVIAESIRPQMTMLWRLPNSPIYRNIKQESAGQFVPGIVILRIGSSMYFANVAFIREYISKMIREFSEASDIAAAGAPQSAAAGRHVAAKTTTATSTTTNTTIRSSPGSPGDGGDGDGGDGDGSWVAPEPIKYIVIEMTPVTSIDSTALHMLEDMQRDLKERGVRLAFSTVNNRVEDTLKRAGLIDKVGRQWIHPSVHSAVQHCIRHRRREISKVDTTEADSADGTAETVNVTVT